MDTLVKPYIETTPLFRYFPKSFWLRFFFRYLTETIVKNSTIRKQNAALVFKAVYEKSDIGVSVLLDFLENNLENITAT